VTMRLAPFRSSRVFIGLDVERAFTVPVCPVSGSLPVVHRRELSGGFAPSAVYRQYESLPAYYDVSASDVLRKAAGRPHLDLGSTFFSLTLRAGLAGHTTLHIFELARFDAMLLSLLGFPAR